MTCARDVDALRLSEASLRQKALAAGADHWPDAAVERYKLDARIALARTARERFFIRHERAVARVCDALTSAAMLMAALLCIKVMIGAWL